MRLTHETMRVITAADMSESFPLGQIAMSFAEYVGGHLALHFLGCADTSAHCHEAECGVHRAAFFVLNADLWYQAA